MLGFDGVPAGFENEGEDQMPVTGRQGEDGRVVQIQAGETSAGSPSNQEPKKSKALQRAEAKVRAQGIANRIDPPRPTTTTPNRDALNALSVLGLGKMMPLGNIGNAILREQRRTNDLLEQLIALQSRSAESKPPEPAE